MINDDTVYSENAIRTYTGKVFDLKVMDPESICIEDIAHALSLTCRFSGHIDGLYSVAQHSLMANYYASPENKLQALMHDASEAYIGDMPSPFKKMMPDYKMIENNLMKQIAIKYKFDWPLCQEVKDIDRRLLDQEWDSLIMKRNDFVRYLEPKEVEYVFLKVFRELTEGKV